MNLTYSQIYFWEVWINGKKLNAFITILKQSRTRTVTHIFGRPVFIYSVVRFKSNGSVSVQIPIKRTDICLSAIRVVVWYSDPHCSFYLSLLPNSLTEGSPRLPIHLWSVLNLRFRLHAHKDMYFYF